MQYALITLKDTPFIIDAHELSALDTFHDGIRDLGPKPDENGPLYVAYGVYMPQPGIEWEDAMGHLLERQRKPVPAAGEPQLHRDHPGDRAVLRRNDNGGRR